MIKRCKMNFTYENDTYPKLIITSGDGLEIRFAFDDGNLWFISAGDIIEEAEPEAQDLARLHVYIDGEVVSIWEIARRAEEEFPAMQEEYDLEQAEEDDMARELSSPYLTGRI